MHTLNQEKPQYVAPKLYIFTIPVQNGSGHWQKITTDYIALNYNGNKL
jgi:hypothetical protein